MTYSPIALRQLLAATDLSAAAALAVQRAGLLAREHGAALQVAHVIDQGWLDDIARWLRQRPSIPAELHAHAGNELAAQAAIAGPDARTMLLDGDPVTALSAAAQGCNADLLVAGARGANPLHALVIGGTVERLIRRAQRPLLMVRRPAPGPYRRVLVALDFSPWSLATLATVRAIAPQAHLVLHHSFSLPFGDKLHYAGVDQSLIGDYREHARHEGLTGLQCIVREAHLREADYTLSLSEGDAPQRILDAASARDCELIAIGKHGRHAAEDLLLGSVTRHVIEEAQTDVLVSTAHAPR